MNALASSSLYVSADRKAGFEYQNYSPWAQNAVSYDHRGRLQPFVETEEQRRARAEFIRKRDFSRRINAWIQDSSSSNSSKSDTDSLRTIDEDEEEPEVIYSTSPALAAARSWGGAGSPPNTRPLSRHLRASSRTSSRSSLSSISEESV